MSSRRSSCPAESGISPATGRLWPWLLAAGPCAVVVASLFSAWLAWRGGDVVVADNYYKTGLMINRRLAAEPASSPAPAATVTVDASGNVSVRLWPSTAAPSYLRLSVQRTGSGAGSVAMLRREGNRGDWIGRLPDIAPGWRVLTLDSDVWRLPVTVIDRIPQTLRLGAAGPAT